MAYLLGGKKAVVTGAGSGMGRAIAVALAAEGAAVGAHARRTDQLGDTSDAIRRAGGTVWEFEADLSDSAAIRDFSERALAALGGIDILVNNAGVLGIASVLEMDEDLWDRTMAVNLKAPWLVTRAFLPAMIRAGGGRLIYNASVSGKMSEAQGSAYNASKSGLIGFVRCLAAEVGPQGITANAICPGWVDTPMAHWAWGQMPLASGKTQKEAYDAGMRANMLGALIEPTDIANAVVFLASDKARCITAQSINVCAGLCYW